MKYKGCPICGSEYMCKCKNKTKQLKNVNLDKERAYIKTFVGEQEITGINKSTWWVQCGPWRSWASYPQQEVRIEKR